MAQAQASQKVDQTVDPQGGATLIVKRHFKAPQEAVFKAFTEAEELAKWFGPEGVTVKNVTSDPRPGGGYFMEFHSEEKGHTISLSGTYQEVVPHERLVYTWVWDRGGYGGRETLVTLTFEPAKGGTEMTLVHERLLDEEARREHNGGWNSCLDCLEVMLAA